MCGLLDCYLKKFAHLTTEKNRAPHQPILLLTVLALVGSGEITRNFVEISPALVKRFETFWDSLLPDTLPGNIVLPFCSLADTGFWHLRPRSDSSVSAEENIRTLEQLRAAYFGAMFDDDLFPLLKMAPLRGKLQQVLLKTYFPAIQETPAIQHTGKENDNPQPRK